MAGVAPGVLAVLLDPNQDGVQQIAHWLTSHEVRGLAAIDIVAHGSDGAIQLGSTLLSAGTIAEHQAALATIGDALAPGGAIQLFGCAVAQDATGVAFMQKLSQATGNAHIAAASHAVGAAAEGASWTLDVDVGTVAVAIPFTPATVAAFPDVLSVTANQIFFSAWDGQGGAVDRVEQIGVNGSALVNGSAIDLGDASQSADAGLNATSSGIAVDTARNTFFVAVDQATTGTHTMIEKGNINNPGSLTTLFTNPIPNFGQSATAPEVAQLGGLALDVQHGQLYFAQATEDSNTGNPVEADTGIYRISVNGGAATRITPAVNSLAIRCT